MQRDPSAPLPSPGGTASDRAREYRAVSPGPAATAGPIRAPARAGRAEIRFVVGSADGPCSQPWVIRTRAERATGSSWVWVGPAHALRAPSQPPPGTTVRPGNQGVVVPDGEPHTDPGAPLVLLGGPQFDIGAAGVEVVPGWPVAAIILIPPAAVNSPLAPRHSPRLTYHPPPGQGRVFQAIVAWAGPAAAPLSLAAGNDAGALRLPGAPTVRVWINHVPHPPGLDQLVLAAQRHHEAPATEHARRGAFLHAITGQQLPVLIDLGIPRHD